MQSDWAGGYNAELPYIATYLPAQAPAEMALVAAVAGVEQELPREGLRFLDLGCGRGATVLALAAANPSWEVIGLDAMPAHVAEARSIAAEAGLDNARFLEADLATLDEAAAARLLPEVDVISLHGVWAWVSDAVRAGIINAARSRLRAGGMLLVTYNALPAWAGDMTLQRLLRDLVTGSHGPLDARMGAALGLAQRLHAGGAKTLQGSEAIEKLAAVPPPARAAYARYAIHEFLPAHWRPCWPQDVTAAFAGAKLAPVGPAVLGFHFSELLLDDRQKAALAALPPGLDGEFLRDLFIPPTLRQDLFVRGRRPAEIEPAVGNAVLALRRLPRDGAVRWMMPGRVAELPAPVTRAALSALARRPCSVADLAALPEMQDTTPGELLVVLAGSGVAAPVWRAAPDAAAAIRAHRFNGVLLRRLGTDAMAAGGELPAAVPMLGAGLPMKPIALATLLALQEAAAAGRPPPEAGAIARGILSADSPEEQIAWTEGQVATALAEGAPAWAALGLV